MNRCTRAPAYLLSLMLALPGLPVQAASREVTCESHGMRHAYCSTGRHGSVRLVDSSGFWPCKQNETWGTDSHGIWVDQGCKGRFRVEDDSAGSSSDRNAAIGAAVGIGLLAVLAASHDKHDEHADHASSMPSWMIGSYHGYNPRYRIETELSIGSSGRVEGRARGQTVYGRWTGGDVLQFDDGVRLAVTRTDRGLRLTQVGDSSNIVEYYRD